MSANDRQVDGKHYQGDGIQPWDYIDSHDMDYLEGSVIKYVTRWRAKGGVNDLRKAIHFLEKRIELEMAPDINTDESNTGTRDGPEIEAWRDADSPYPDLVGGAS